MRKNNAINFILLFAAILAQRVLFTLSDFPYIQMPFSTALEIFDSFGATLLATLYSFFPIPFALFLFWGTSSELTEGYGKLVIIRSYGRSLICIQKIGKLFLKMAGIAYFQILIFTINNNSWENISLTVMIYVIAAYYLGLFAIILLQFYLELMIDTTYANTTVIIFSLISIFIGNIVLSAQKGKWLIFILFPNLMFGRRNGAIETNWPVINCKQTILIAIIWCIILTALSLLKFKNKDIA
ncbi:MAG: DUF2705 family protein [Clostridiaceae bacterium]|nr:DUF2705 family protein [Clostridiaceae bacterium]